MWQRLTVAVATLSVFWTLFLLIFGGVNFQLLGIRIRSNDWTDSATIAIVSIAIYVWLRRRALGASIAEKARSTGSNIVSWLRVPENLILLAILVVAAIARYWAITFGLPHPAARPDEEAVSSLAGSYLHGSFEQTTFTYPPLFIMVAAATFWILFQWWPSTLSRLNLGTGPYEPSTAAVRTVQRVLSATAGVVSVWLVFRIGLRLFDRTTALVAAAFLALAFLHVRDSHFGVTDMPMTCMLLMAVLAIVRLSQSGSQRDLVLAGILTGLAIATKYNAALLALPASFAVLIDPLRRTATNRVMRIAVLGAIVLATFLIVCPYSVIHWQAFLRDLEEVQRHLRVGHGVDLGRGWVHHLTTNLRHGLGLPLLLTGIAGIFLVVWREGRSGVLLVLFPVAYYALSGSGRTVFARHALPLVPFLCLTAAYLVVASSAWIARALDQPAWRAPLATALTLVVLWPSAMSVVAFDRLISREDSRLLARRWIEARFEPGTTILQLGQTNGHAYIFYEKDYVLSEVPTDARPSLVILVSSPLASPDLDGIAPWVRREYDLKYARKVVDETDPANTYDRQDEFFVPIGGFQRVERPGPNLRIYVRRDLAIADPIVADW